MVSTVQAQLGRCCISLTRSQGSQLQEMKAEMWQQELAQVHGMCGSKGIVDGEHENMRGLQKNI